MKRTFLFLVVAFCFLSVRAQQTSLVIDNQTPGWLSSKIAYGDQKTLQNLKLTGYINAEDLKSLPVNQTETVGDHQMQRRRPHLSIINTVILPRKLQPVCVFDIQKCKIIKP